MGTFMGADEELKQHSVSDNHFRTIDLRSRVREAIGNPELARTDRTRPVRRKTWISLAATCILLLSFTAYAATGHLQIFNAKGKVVLHTVDPNLSSYPDKLIRELEIYRQQVLSQLKPGELAAYYIKDEYINTLNGYDTVNPVKFEKAPVYYHSYIKFLKEQIRTTAPPVKLPRELPKRLSFAYGQIDPVVPSGEQREPLKQRLIDRANAETSSEKLFVEKLSWSKASYTVMYLSDSTSDTAVIIMGGYGMSASITKGASDVAEKIKLKQQEGIYQKAVNGEEKLIWYDTKQGVVYTIIVNKPGLMSKQELITMGESMISEEF